MTTVRQEPALHGPELHCAAAAREAHATDHPRIPINLNSYARERDRLVFAFAGPDSSKPCSRLTAVAWETGPAGPRCHALSPTRLSHTATPSASLGDPGVARALASDQGAHLGLPVLPLPALPRVAGLVRSVGVPAKLGEDALECGDDLAAVHIALAELQP